MATNAEQAYERLKVGEGREEGTGEWLEITQERINQFADVTEDHQFIHVDPDRCRELSPWGVPIAHGFLTLEDACELEYLISAPYEPGAAVGVRWDDPALGIDWPFEPAVISPRDAAFADLDIEGVRKDGPAGLA